nr:n-acetylglucosaminyl-phosphatidylinositol de-n-acetylase [Quercus suber]
MNVLFWQLPVLFFGLWIFTAYMSQSFPTLRNKRIVLLIAHPDDEAMFFSPTVLALTRPELGNTVLILCLSSGDADGLGHIRKEELRESALQLGLRSSEHVVVVEDAKLPDSMTTDWDPKYISGILTQYFGAAIATTPSTSAPVAAIDAIITFDAQGVSGHPNHRSLYRGSVAFLRNLMQRHAGWECPIKLYTLTSVNVLRKYSSVLDALTTIVYCITRRKDRGGGFPSPIMVVSGPSGVRRAQRAMTTAHESQMRWFRWGWIGISRQHPTPNIKRLLQPPRSTQCSIPFIAGAPRSGIVIERRTLHVVAILIECVPAVVFGKKLLDFPVTHTLTHREFEELHDDIHSQEDRTEDVHDHEQADRVGRSHACPVLESEKRDDKADDEHGYSTATKQPDREGGSVLVELKPHKTIDHEGNTGCRRQSKLDSDEVWKGCGARGDDTAVYKQRRNSEQSVRIEESRDFLAAWSRWISPQFLGKTKSSRALVG